MANIRRIIERVDDIKPNAFTAETKLAWFGELDGRIAADVMLMGIEEIRQMEYTYPNSLDAEPLVGFPHDGIYEQYLCAKIDYANGEYSKYQNSMEMFNAHYDNFINWFIRTYAPARGYSCGASGKPPYYISAYGLAVQHGYTGTLKEWLSSLNGKPVELRCVENVIQWRWRDESEEGWQVLWDGASAADGIFQNARNEALRAENAATSAEASAEEAEANVKRAENAVKYKQNKLGWVTDEDIEAMFDGTYEGEEDEDPEGNGYAEKCYELIETFTLDEAMAWERSKEPDGTPYKFERIYVAMMCPPHNDGQASDGIFRTFFDKKYLVNIYCGAPENHNSYAAIEVRPEQGSWRITRSNWENNRHIVNSQKHAAEFGDNWDTKPLYPARTTKEYPYIDKIVHQGILPAGTKILIWGVRA